MNAVVAEKEQDNVTELRAPGPGERLRNARLAMDMDISSAAKKLHLTGDMVDALECDDYSEMPARVFVRGYVRNYARLVDLPVESVAKQFDDLWPENESALKVDHAPRLASDTKPGGGAWGSLLTWLLVMGGGALFLLWWLGHLDGLLSARESSPPAAPAAQTELPPAGQLLPRPASETVPPAAPGTLLLPPPVPVEAAPEEPVAPAPAPVVSEPEPAVSEPEPVVAEPPEPREVAAVPVPAPAVPQPAPEPTAAAPEIKVAFSEDCWVDIRSADRKFRLFGTMRKGTVRTLGGEAPYRMILGNAGAVSVTVDGEAFDLTPHTRENIARLTLTP